MIRRRLVAEGTIGAVVLSLLLFAPPHAARVEPADPGRLFKRGLTFDQFLSHLTARRDLWEKNALRAVPRPELVDRLRHVRKGLRFLIVAADWCGDSANSVPYIARTASSAGVEVRIVDRVAGQALMRLHRAPDGRAVTPTVVLMRDGRDVGAWVERPRDLQRIFLSMASSAESRLKFAESQSWYDADCGVTTLNEVIALAERTAAAR